MPAPTLSALFDAAALEVRAATSALPEAPTPEEARTLTQQLGDLVGQLHAYPAALARDSSHTPRPRATQTALTEASADLRTHLRSASERLDEAVRYSGDLSSPAGPPVGHLETAAAHLGASRDLLYSHRGPDGAALTPYAALLAQASAQQYVLHRVADVTWETSQYATWLAGRADHPGARTRIDSAAGDLERGAVIGRHATRDAAPELAALPLAAAPATVQPFHPDLPGTLAHVSDSADRLARAAYVAPRDGAPPLSGSDMQQTARSLALGHLLSGRVLLHVAAEHPEAANELHSGADRFRAGAHAWQQAAQRWRRIVDTADPREHPKLPRYSYEAVRRGDAGPMPRTQPHPAAADAHHLAVRVGQLLYGAGWRPDQGTGTPRPTAAILENAGGLGGLAAGLYPLPAAARQVARSAPHLLPRIAPGLVSDEIEQRPTGLARHERFYPVTATQLDALADAHPSAAQAADQTAEVLVRVAQAHGHAVPRAALDAAVRGAPAAAPPAPTAAERLANVLGGPDVADVARATSNTVSHGPRPGQPRPAAPFPAPRTDAPRPRHHQ